MPTFVPRYFYLDLFKHVMHHVIRLHLRTHTLKVEAAAWLEGGSCICNRFPGGDENFQNEVHYLIFCQEHQVCELIRYSIYWLHLFLRQDFSTTQPYLLQQVNNQFVHNFLSRQYTRFFLFLSELME